MYITITSSKVPPEHSERVEIFLRDFLPRLKQQKGVLAIYHFARQDKDDESTLVVWKSQEDVKRYREGELIKEAIAFESQLNLPSTRDSYPLIYGTSVEFETVQEGNSVSDVLGDPILEKAVSDGCRRLTALLSSSAKEKANLASLAIGKHGIESSDSFDLYGLAEDEVIKQFRRLTKQESDILVFYILAASLERIKAEQEDSLSEMSAMDQLVLQQSMEKKQQFESIFSNLLKTFQQTGTGVIANLK
jgi:heme-degrading monooxygenase HmoA